MLSKKQINRMAATIRQQVGAAEACDNDGARLQAKQALYTVALEFACMARKENPRFDGECFFDACGMRGW